MLVHDFLQDSAERSPDKVALVCDGQRLTYAQVEEQANRVANGLLALGVQRGDRVAIWLPNSVETVIAIFGILKAGATFTVINSTTKPGKLVPELEERRKMMPLVDIRVWRADILELRPESAARSVVS